MESSKEKRKKPAQRDSRQAVSLLENGDYY